MYKGYAVWEAFIFEKPTYCLFIYKDNFNPLTPTRTLVTPFTEISILFWEGIIKKISYERRAYESVNEKSLS